MSKLLSRTEASHGAPNWRLLRGKLHLAVKASDFVSAIDFVARVARIAEDQQHHPDLDIRYNRVFITVWSHDVGGVTDRDLMFAAAVTELVTERGLSVSAHPLTVAELAIDTDDASRIAPFWAAVLGGKVVDEHDVVDRFTRLPNVWFQVSDTPPGERGRMHVDVTVPHDERSSRIKAAVAAGGRVVDDSHLPRFCVLADPDGNLACVCTWEGRDESEAESAGAVASHA